MSRILYYLLSAILWILLQAFVFHRIQIEQSLLSHLHIILYILFLIHLPIRINRLLYMLIAFSMGMVIDLIILTPGIHAASAVALAFSRKYILDLLEPRAGYGVNIRPTMYHLGMSWYLIYLAITTFLYLLIFFILQSFSLVYISDIWLNTIISFAVVYILSIILQVIVWPK